MKGCIESPLKPFLQLASLPLWNGAWGQSTTPSQVNNAFHNADVASANLEKSKAYYQAGNAFETEASVCYVLIKDHQFIPLGMYLKKAEARRMKALANAVLNDTM